MANGFLGSLTVWGCGNITPRFGSRSVVQKVICQSRLIFDCGFAGPFSPVLLTIFFYSRLFRLFSILFRPSSVDVGQRQASQITRVKTWLLYCFSLVSDPRRFLEVQSISPDTIKFLRFYCLLPAL